MIEFIAGFVIGGTIFFGVGYLLSYFWENP